MAHNRITMSTSNRLVSGIDPNTPDGLRRANLQGATECLIAAETLDKVEQADFTAGYIVAFHAIELGLKAYLAKRGATADSLRKLSRSVGNAARHGRRPRAVRMDQRVALRWREDQI